MFIFNKQTSKKDTEIILGVLDLVMRSLERVRTLPGDRGYKHERDWNSFPGFGVEETMQQGKQ